jgi:hypothetical protein
MVAAAITTETTATTTIEFTGENLIGYIIYE